MNKFVAPPARRLTYYFGAWTLVSATAFLVGCSEPNAVKNTVSGKVQMDGKNVGGIVEFVWDDNKTAMSPITNGDYMIQDTKPGKVKIVVKSNTPPGQTTLKNPTGMKDGPKMAEGNVNVAGGVDPPAKYTNPATTPLTHELKGGKEKYDITLSN